MAAAFSNLNLKRVICHEVLLSSDLQGGRDPQYSEQLLALDQRGRELLCKRLIDALGSDSHSVEVEVQLDGEGSAFNLLTKLLDAESKALTEVSKELALRLTKAQTSGSIKAGVVVLMDGRIGSNADPRRFIAVLKAEADAAFLKESTGNGFTLKFLSETVLGPQQRLYKIGFFIEKQPSVELECLRSKTDFEIIVYDHQMSKTSGNNAAQYFYSTFLGCKLAENSQTLTKVFYEETSKHIDETKLPIRKRVELKNDLISYLRSQEPHISPKVFADRHLPSALHDGYFNCLKTVKFPQRNISKDISLITRRLQVRRMIFSNNVRITAPQENFSEMVKFVGTSNGWTTVKILGELESQK